MTFLARANVGIFLMLLGLFPAPAAGQSTALQVQLCYDDAKDTSLRIDACSAAIASARIIDLRPILAQRAQLYVDIDMEPQAAEDIAAAKNFSDNDFDIPYLNDLRLCNNEMERASDRLEACDRAIARAREEDLPPLLMQRGQIYLAEDMTAQAI
jgi:hypothetical protein